VAGAIGREISGGFGAVTASRGIDEASAGASLLTKGQSGFVVAFDDEDRPVANRGAQAQALGRGVRDSAARLCDRRRGRAQEAVRGAHDLVTDGSAWTFDIPKIYLSTAEGLVRALTE
jgi:hypothetical protein